MKLEKIRLENKNIRLEVSVFGGKILSMYNKDSSSEWLFQSESEEFIPAADGSFTREVAFGCDEMFPTILPEASLQKDGSAVNLPDHGELWSHDWEILSQEEDSIEMKSDGTVLPYRFVRRILLSDQSVVCRYIVINLSDTAIPALWTPHPLFSFFPETEIHVPGDCRTISQAGYGGELGPYLNKIEWGEGGEVPDAGKLLRPGTLKQGSAYKFYCSEAVSEGKVVITDRRGKMTMTYPPSILPWLGFWINNGGFGNQYNIAPEPATSPFDSPSRSEAFGIAAVWEAGEIREWELSYSFES